MNPGLVVKLRPSGPWRIGPDSGARNRVDVIYHSDSLYSAVTAAMFRLGWLDEWLDATARTAAPAVSFSSCFPYLGDIVFVVPPRTVWPPASPSAKAARIRWKSARFVPLTVVQSILAGQRLDDNQWTVDGPSDCLVPTGKPGPFRTAVRSNAGIDRLTGASERHSTACIEFRPGSGLWTVASFADDAAHEQWSGRVKAAFRLLADTGFGGERSRGWGRSDAPEFIDGMLPDLILPLPTESAAASAPPSDLPEVSVTAVPPIAAFAQRRGETPTAEPTNPEEPAAVSEPPAPPLETASPESEATLEEPPAALAAAASDASATTEAVAVAEPPASVTEPTPVEAPASEPAPTEAPASEPAPVAESAAPEAIATAPEPAPAEAPASEPALVAETAAPETISADSEPAPTEAPASEPAPVAETAAPETIAASEPAPTEAPASEPAPVAEPAAPEPIAAAPEPAPTEEPATEPAPTIETAPEPEPPVATAPTHPHWLLSLFTPAAADSVDWRRGNYTVLPRGGRIDSPAGSGELKKQIQMVAEGSVLYAESAPRGSAADVAPDGFAHPVFRAGFAVAIPLPEVR